MRKCTVVMLLAVLVVLSLTVHVVTSVSAQAGYKPSVPQISSIQLVDSSYDVLPSTTSTVNQYTGEETIITKPGYRLAQKSIEVSIKNQPFTPYTGENGKEVNLYYQIQFKGHFGEYWQICNDNVVQSNSGYTVVSQVANYATGDQLDFKVIAMIGYLRMSIDHIGPPFIWELQLITCSDWSSVQVFTVSDSPSASALSTQTAPFPPVTSDGNGQPQFPSQTQPPNSSIFNNPLFMFGVGAFFVGVIIVVVLVIFRRQPKVSIQTNTYVESSLNFLVFYQFMLVRCEW